MDLLSLVRQATKDGTAVKYVDGYYIFGRHKFPESTPTAFKRTHISGGYYTLRDIIFFLENADLSISEYRNKISNAVGVTPVTVPDKKDLKRYLTGEIDNCEQIDSAVASISVIDTVASDISIRNIASAKLAAREMEGQRKKFADILDDRVKSNWSFSESEPFTFDPEFIQADKMYLASLRSDEVAATDRTMVLCKPGADFSFALKLINDHVLKPPEPTRSSTSESSKRPRPESSSSVGSSVERSQERPRDDQQRPQKMPRSSGASSSSRSSSTQHVPASQMGGTILIVPNSLSSVLCSLNAVEFLRDGRYVSTEEKRASGAKREPEQKFQYTLKSGKTVKFRVIDNPSKLRDDDWSRVAAVFAQGQAWQFKGWKWSNPVELFSNVFGAHVTMSDRDVDATIRSWNCKVFEINKSKRHLDASKAREFWMQLEDYLTAKKPWLLK